MSKRATRQQRMDICRLTSEAMSSILEARRISGPEARKLKLRIEQLENIFQSWITMVISDQGVITAQDEDGETLRPERFYPPGFAVKSLDEQCRILSFIFPELNWSTISPETIGITQAGADGFFIVPLWQRLAKTYYKALIRVLSVVDKQRGLTGLTSIGYRLYDRTVKMMSEISEKQAGDFIVFPAQLGSRHKGLSLYQTRQKFLPNEFGLDVFTVACILLTHPERFATMRDLWLVCAGNKFDYEKTGKTEYTPVFYYNVATRPNKLEELRLDAIWSGEEEMTNYGLATGFMINT